MIVHECRVFPLVSYTAYRMAVRIKQGCNTKITSRNHINLVSLDHLCVNQCCKQDKQGNLVCQTSCCFISPAILAQDLYRSTQLPLAMGVLTPGHFCVYRAGYQPILVMLLASWSMMPHIAYCTCTIQPSVHNYNSPHFALCVHILLIQL